MSLRTLETMSKKKPNSKYAGMVRIDAGVLDRVNLAASLMGGTTAAAYVTEVLRRQTDLDIAREAKKLAMQSNTTSES